MAGFLARLARRGGREGAVHGLDHAHGGCTRTSERCAPFTQSSHESGAEVAAQRCAPLMGVVCCALGVRHRFSLVLGWGDAGAGVSFCR